MVMVNRWIILIYVSIAFLGLAVGLLPGEEWFDSIVIRSLVLAAIGGFGLGVASGWSIYLTQREFAEDKSPS